MNVDWKDRQQEVIVTASVFISKPDVSIEELSRSEELMATAFLFFFPLSFHHSLCHSVHRSLRP